MKAMGAGSATIRSPAASVTDSIGSVLIKKFQMKNLKKLLGFSSRQSIAPKLARHHNRDTKSVQSSERAQEKKSSGKAVSVAQTCDVAAANLRPDLAEECNSAARFHNVMNCPLIDLRRKGCQNIDYCPSETSVQCDDHCSRNNADICRLPSAWSSESRSKPGQAPQCEFDAFKMPCSNNTNNNFAHRDKHGRKSLPATVRKAFTNICKLSASPETSKDFVCKTSYRRSSDSTQITTLSLSSSQHTDLDPLESPLPAWPCCDEATQPQILSKMKNSSVPAPVTSTMKEALSISSLPPIMFDFSADDEPSFEKIFGIDRENIVLSCSLQERKPTSEVSPKGRGEQAHSEWMNNSLRKREQTEMSEVAQHGSKENEYYNLSESSIQESGRNTENLREKLSPALEYNSFCNNPQLLGNFTAFQNVHNRAKSIEHQFDPRMIFSTLQMILECMELVQSALQSMLNHFTHPSSEILAVQERRMLVIQDHVADLMRSFRQFQALLAVAPQRLSNMRYLLLPCNNSLGELCEYLLSMEDDLMDSQRYFNQSITLTLLKMCCAVQVLSNVVSRGKRSFMRSVTSTSMHLQYPTQLYDLNDRLRGYLQPFVELLVRRIQVLERLRKLSRQAGHEWDRVDTWQEFLPSLYCLISTIRALTPQFLPDTDGDFWSLTKILPQTKLPSVFDTFLSEFYRAMVTPDFAVDNPQGFSSLFYSLLYIIDSVIRQHAVILQNLNIVLHN